MRNLRIVLFLMGVLLILGALGNEELELMPMVWVSIVGLFLMVLNISAIVPKGEMK